MTGRWRPAGLLALVAALAGCGEDPGNASGEQPPAAFWTRCATCHGSDGLGVGGSLSLATAHDTWGGEGITGLVRAGLDGGLMPAFSADQLPDGELQAIVDWLARLARAEGPVSTPSP